MSKASDLLPPYEEVIFNNSALELCLIQVKYPPVQRFADDRYMLGIREALSSEYPLVNTEQGMNIVITPQGVNQTPGASMLRFTSIDSRWSVILASDFVTLETRHYTSFDELSTRFADVLSDIATHFHPRHLLRFGLRYINEFRHPHGDSYEAWTRLLNPGLLGLGARGVLGGNVEQSIGEVLTRRDDGRLLVRHGFLKGSTIIPTLMYPAKTGSFYLLDLDYYDEAAVKFNVDIPVERMVRYHEFIHRVFRWSIGEGELYQYLRGEV